MAAKEIYSQPEKYGFVIQKDQLYPPVKSRQITIDSTVDNWPRLALQQGTNYKNLKLLNPWIRARNMKNKTRKIYYVQLPKESAAVNVAPVLVEPVVPSEE